MMRFGLAFALSIALVAGAWYALRPPTIDACLSGSETEQAACAHAIIEKRLESESAADMLVDFQSRFTARNCHFLGHVVGQELFKKSGSLEVALTECSDRCARACIHGAVGKALASVPGIGATEEDLAHPNVDLIRSEGKKLCAGSFHACHGVGHVLFWLLSDLPQALAMCDSVAENARMAAVCHRGIFMENASPKSLLGTGEKQFSDTEDILSPCSTVPSTYALVCFRSLSYVQEKTFAEKGVVDADEKLEARKAACASLSASDLREACSEGVGFSLRIPPTRDAGDAHAVCTSLPHQRERAACAHGYTQDLALHGTLDKIGPFCEQWEDEMGKIACYQGPLDSIPTSDEEEYIQKERLCSSAVDDICHNVLVEYTAKRTFIFPALHW